MCSCYRLFALLLQTFSAVSKKCVHQKKLFAASIELFIGTRISYGGQDCASECPYQLTRAPILPLSAARTLSNRESAKRSRQRRQERLKELEYVTVAMRAELASVGQQFEAAYHQATKYKLENDVLHMEVQRLRSEMRDTMSGKIYFSDPPECLPNTAKTSAAKESLGQLESDSTFSGHRIRTAKEELSLDAPSSSSGQEKTAVPFLLEEATVWYNFGLHGGGVIPTDPSNVVEASVDNAGEEGCSKDDMWFQDLVLGLADP